MREMIPVFLLLSNREYRYSTEKKTFASPIIFSKLSTIADKKTNLFTLISIRNNEIQSKMEGRCKMGAKTFKKCCHKRCHSFLCIKNTTVFFNFFI